MQVKSLDIKELKVKAKALMEEIANLSLDRNMKKLKDLKTVAKRRKERAQTLTVIRQKELLAQLELISKQSSGVSLQIEEKNEKVEIKKRKDKFDN